MGPTAKPDLQKGCIVDRGYGHRRDRYGDASREEDLLDQRERHCTLRPCYLRADGHDSRSRWAVEGEGWRGTAGRRSACGRNCGEHESGMRGSEEGVFRPGRHWGRRQYFVRMRGWRSPEREDLHPRQLVSRTAREYQTREARGLRNSDRVPARIPGAFGVVRGLHRELARHALREPRSR